MNDTRAKDTKTMIAKLGVFFPDLLYKQRKHIIDVLMGVADKEIITKK